MPTYSDDGQWWWDGRAWQPVDREQPQRSRRGLLIAGIAVLAIIVAVGVVAVAGSR